MKVTNIFKNKRFKHGSIATIVTIGFVAIIVLVNILSSLIIDRFSGGIDLTESGIYQLSEETKQAVNDLDEQVNITVLANQDQFKTAGTIYTQAEKMLTNIEKMSDKLKVEYVDLYNDPTYPSKYPNENIQPGEIIVESSKRYKILTQDDMESTKTDPTTGSVTEAYTTVEPSVVSAIIYVTDQNPSTVNLVSGHNEKGLGTFSSLLGRNNYKVEEISLLTGTISPETSFVIITAPNVDYTKEEIKKLEAYLENDGKYGKNVMFIADASTPSLPNLESFLDEWGIGLGTGVAYETDVKNMYPNYPTISVNKVLDNEYIKNMRDIGLPLLMPETRPLEIKSTESGNRTTQALLKTSETTVIRPSGADKTWTADDKEKQALNTILAGTKTKTTDGEETKSNVFAMGSYYMFDVNFLGESAFANADYVVTLLNNASDKHDSIAIAPKSIYPAKLSINQSQVTILTWVFLVIVPIAVLASGLFVWLSRRNR